MNRRLFASSLLACLSFAQISQRLPSWLVPYPGSNPQTEISENLVESSYTTEASIQQVLAHLRSAFEQAGVAFLPGSDGIGTSVRASTSECDLLIKLREVSAGTRVEPAAPARSGDG